MATNEKLKLSTAKERVKWMRKGPLTTRTWWNIINEVELNECKAYWDYRDEFSKEQIEQIEENGYKGYDSVLDSIMDLNIDYVNEILYEQRKELIDALEIDDFMPDFLSEFKKELEEENGYDSDDEDLLDDLKSRINNYGEDLYNQIHDTIMDFQSYNWNLNKLSIPHTRERFIVLDRYEMKDLVSNELLAFAKRYSLNYDDLDFDKEDFIFRTYESLDNVNEIADAAEELKNPYISKTITFNYHQYFYDEDENEFSFEVCKTIEVNENVIFEDDNEYGENEWNHIGDLDIVVPRKEDAKTLVDLVGNAPFIGSAESEADVFGLIDDFIIIESDYLSEDTYTVFGFNIKTQMWEERNLTPVDIALAKEIKMRDSLEKDTVITIDGTLKIKKTAA